jgi:hypothetical protein
MTTGVGPAKNGSARAAPERNARFAYWACGHSPEPVSQTMFISLAAGSLIEICRM